jgi:DNA polymerase
MSPQLLAALLQWQIELGADEAIGDIPCDRYAESQSTQVAAKPRGPAPTSSATDTSSQSSAPPATLDPALQATALAARAVSLEELAVLQSGFEHCELRKGARNFVFSDGRAGSRVMILGEAPGEQEDRQGKPFVGKAGQMLDRMFATIGLSRTNPDLETGLYISNCLPWRPPMNRDPTAQEIAMMLPFVRRHIELAAPEVLVIMGNSAAHAILGRKGITRLRGQWEQALGLPVLPMLHPAYLLRNPLAKREAWADLLTLLDRLTK